MISPKSFIIASALVISSTLQVSAHILRDSIGVETKDGKVYVLYKVMAGETLYSISKKYNTTPDVIKQLNSGLSGGLQVGQVIRVPSRVQTPAPAAPANGNSGVSYKTHTVAAGETLYSISRQYNVSVDDIRASNPDLQSSISVGQTIKIPVKGGTAATTPAAPATPAQPANTVKYTVKSGETLYSIATANKISVDQLKQYNPGISNSLTVGQVINVPAKAAAQNPQATAPAPVPADNNADPTTQLTDNTVVAPVAVPPSTTPVTPPPAPAPSNVPTGPAPGEKQNLPSASVPKPNANYKRVSENGLAIVATESNTNFFYAWHKTAPVGTIIQVTNEITGQSIFVKVMGKLPDNSGEKVVIRMTKKAWQKLGATDEKISVSLNYLL